MGDLIKFPQDRIIYYEELFERVRQFQRNELPGQHPMVNQQTLYLINDLEKVVRELKKITGEAPGKIADACYSHMFDIIQDDGATRQKVIKGIKKIIHDGKIIYDE